MLSNACFSTFELIISILHLMECLIGSLMFMSFLYGLLHVLLLLILRWILSKSNFKSYCISVPKNFTAASFQQIYTRDFGMFILTYILQGKNILVHTASFGRFENNHRYYGKLLNIVHLRQTNHRSLGDHRRLFPRECIDPSNSSRKRRMLNLEISVILDLH